MWYDTIVVECFCLERTLIMLKKILPVLCKFFSLTFALYTCVSFGFLALDRAFGVEAAPGWSGVIALFLQILLFCALTALFHTLLDLPKKLNPVLAALAKFLLTYGAFYLCLFRPQSAGGGINLVVISALFVAVYAVVALVAAGLRALARKADAPQEYTKQFENVSSEKKDENDA